VRRMRLFWRLEVLLARLPDEETLLDLARPIIQCSRDKRQRTGETENRTGYL